LTVYKKAYDNFIAQLSAVRMQIENWSDELEESSSDALEAIDAVLDELEDLEVE